MKTRSSRRQQKPAAPSQRLHKRPKSPRKNRTYERTLLAQALLCTHRPLISEGLISGDFLGCGCGRFALLKAFAAKHRTALCWLERDGCFPLAAGADGLSFHPL